MEKAEIIAAIARGAGISKKEATEVLDSYIKKVRKRFAKPFALDHPVIVVTGDTGSEKKLFPPKKLKVKNSKTGKILTHKTKGRGGPIPPPRKK